MVQLSSLVSPSNVDDIEYPSEDGLPMAESDAQRKSLMYCVEALGLHFDRDPNIYVSGNLLIYYEKGNIHKSVAPDAFVVLGVPKHDRLSYKIWQEGKAPDVVIEIASKSTWQKDIENRKLYARLGVKEYFQFDPTGEYLDSRLLGHWLDDDGTYQPIASETPNKDSIILESMVLKLELRLEVGQLHLYDPERGEYLLTHAEAEAERRRERAGRMQAQAQGIEERTQRLEERSKRLQAEAKAREAEAKADHEAKLRAELEARLRELEAQLAQQKSNS